MPQTNSKRAARNSSTDRKASVDSRKKSKVLASLNFRIVRAKASVPTMTITADQFPEDLGRPSSPPPLPAAMLSNPDLRKLYMSASCPELKAESVVSSDDEQELDVPDRLFEPLETQEEEEDGPFSMDPAPAMEEEEEESEEEDSQELLGTVAVESEVLKPLVGPVKLLEQPSIAEPPVDVVRPTLQPSVSSMSSTSTDSNASTASDLSSRRKLQWKFKGLTLWLELEEFDSDLTRAVEDLSSKHSSPHIPQPHTTAIYGMEHLSVDEAKERLSRVREVLAPLTGDGSWPPFARPTGITSDVAVCGRPGQVCSIAWSELTLASDPAHESALDALHGLFYDDGDIARDRPWKPHNSIAYDNPETNALSLLDTAVYASANPTLLGRGRRVEAISLWSTEGKMEDWTCIDRVRFW
ncbi:hypothetical protein ACHAWF_007184 [Thalassiosira exigua]